MKVGIIGFGRLGKHLCRYLVQDFDVYVYDKENLSSEIQKLGAKNSSLGEICQLPIIIPIVPISEFENIILSIKDKISKDSLIIDVCSVKEHPTKIMQNLLPQEVSILAKSASRN